MFPQQPTIIDEQGVHRFQSNAIVRFLLNSGPFDLNQLALMSFTDEDRCQLSQLTGYSVSGYQELSYVQDRDAEGNDNTAQWTCESEGEHSATTYFLTLSDSESHSNGVFVCSIHLLAVLNSMLAITDASIDVQLVPEPSCSGCKGSGFLLNSYGVACGPCPNGCTTGYLVATAS